MKVKNPNPGTYKGQGLPKSVFDDIKVLNEILREKTRERSDHGMWQDSDN